MCASLCVALLSSGYAFGAGEKVIESKRAGDLYISLSTNSGTLAAGKNDYCILFTRAGSAEPAQVEEAVVEFAQQVGKIRHATKTSSPLVEKPGQYCGEVDLGKQYYRPAFYYVNVKYRENNKKKRTCRFFVALK